MWLSAGTAGASFELTRSVREVLLGADPNVDLTDRAGKVLAELRDQERGTVLPGGTVIERRKDDVRWWTWAGFPANATLAATLSDLTDGEPRFTDSYPRMRQDLTQDMWQEATAERYAAPVLAGRRPRRTDRPEVQRGTARTPRTSHRRCAARRSAIGRAGSGRARALLTLGLNKGSGYEPRFGFTDVFLVTGCGILNGLARERGGDRAAQRVPLPEETG